ncbi:hypothetical protein CYMTET_5215 [Cymbomonas tetramitiformis]|uniref:Uncharacterized protein n=1 Tax=Cymbomonas tetramitiformis TaxID=36881 RepID=A0AAE0LJA8_9CHLO|nr:hypothetical protein CYMTET_5215 [Cymbomonas tetramitiformis]
MLGVHRVLANVDPHDAISDFNAALKAARARSTLDEEDVKSLFIHALDWVFYQPVVARLLLHDQRAAHDLFTIQQWVRECYGAHVKAGTDTAGEPDSVIEDLRTMVIDLKRQLTALTASDGSTPTPRARTSRTAR